MTNQRGRLAFAIAMIGIVIAATGPAQAGSITLHTPPGLKAGASFRFVFITAQGTNASSSSIATYNAFVNAQAGGATYDGTVVNWLVIGSTSSISAINNVGQTMTPVYLADGTLVTSSTTSTGLWSGSLMNPIDEDLSGGLHKFLATWTGTNTNGTASSNSLGDFFGVTLGDSGVTNGEWVHGVALSETFLSNRMFGISQVLTAVPEPSTFWMAGTSIIGCAAFKWLRGRRRRRRQRPA